MQIPFNYSRWRECIADTVCVLVMLLLLVTSFSIIAGASCGASGHDVNDKHLMQLRYNAMTLRVQCLEQERR